MKPALRYGLYAVLIYGAFLLATLPADRVLAQFRDRLPGDVRFHDVSGSAWSGAAASLVVNGRELRRPEWRLQPTALLAGRLQYAMAFDNGASRAAGVVGRGIGGRLVVRDVNATLVAAEFAPLFNAQALGLNGVVDVSLGRLEIRDGSIASADGTLLWKQAGAQSPRPVQLGDINAVFETTGEGVTGTITDQGGPLQINAALLLAPDGGYRVTGTLAPRNPGDATFAQALRMLGNPGPDGKINLSFSGKLPPLGG